MEKNWIMNTFLDTEFAYYNYVLRIRNYVVNVLFRKTFWLCSLTLKVSLEWFVNERTKHYSVWGRRWRKPESPFCLQLSGHCPQGLVLELVSSSGCLKHFLNNFSANSGIVECYENPHSRRGLDIMSIINYLLGVYLNCAPNIFLMQSMYKNIFVHWKYSTVYHHKNYCFCNFLCGVENDQIWPWRIQIVSI